MITKFWTPTEKDIKDAFELGKKAAEAGFIGNAYCQYGFRCPEIQDAWHRGNQNASNRGTP
jgi:hypothetical protein